MKRLILILFILLNPVVSAGWSNWSPYWVICYPEQMELTTGWNLISASGLEEGDSLFIFYNEQYYKWCNTEGVVLDFIYGWDSVKQKHFFRDRLDCRHGYWIFSYVDCYLIVWI